MKRDASRWFHNVWTYKGVHQDGFIMFSSWVFYISSPVMTKPGPTPPPFPSLASHLMNSYVQDLYNKQGTGLP
jgi:hypothetical protein